MERTDNKKWNALYVSSRQEKNAVKILLEKSIEAYVPLVKTMKQWSDRKKMVELPLTNGYIFVRIDVIEQEKVRQTKGVVNFVRSDGKIAIVRQEEIDRLKQLIELGYQMEASGINRQYKPGQKVKITSGALKGIEGFVVQSKEGKSIDILLESIGQSIRVKLPKEILIPVKK